MKEWTGYLYLNGEEKSLSSSVTFMVPEKLYARMQNDIKKGKILSECSYYDDLLRRMEKAFDLAEYTDDEFEEPMREDFDDREEYLEAKQEYQEWRDSIWDSWCIISENIYDPGDMERFKEYFIGKNYPACEDDESEYYSWEKYDEQSMNYSVTVTLDGKGTVTDITIDESNGIETESVKGYLWGDAYPEFGYLIDRIEKALESGEDVDP